MTNTEIVTFNKNFKLHAISDKTYFMFSMEARTKLFHSNFKTECGYITFMYKCCYALPC